MKKYLAVVAAVLMVAFAAPVLAATNPFMDVPMNHWAYDAIGQLAASGILSGYPDGTYKGKQPTTRYEMASALARALAVVDMTKASKQDVEMLKRLVVEFKDELDALGVKVDELDARVAILEKRLGGWQISGSLRQDLTFNGNWRGADENVGHGALSRARLHLERWFGEDESIHFVTRLEGHNTNYKPYGSDLDRVLKLQMFYAEFPFFGGSSMRVGRILDDSIEAPYFLDGVPFSGNMGMGTDSWLLDRYLDVVGIQKSFGLGSVYLHVGHPTDFNGYAWNANNAGGAWEVFATGKFQMTENFGLDVGAQAYFGDDGSVQTDATSGVSTKLNHAWTLFGGLRFNFNQNVELKGMYYYQDLKTEDAATGVEFDNDSTKAFRVVVDIKQDLLKFTSLWLEYNGVDNGFILPSGNAALFNDYQYANSHAAKEVANSDLKIWRVAARQQWNDKWTTFLFYANFKVEREAFDAKFSQYGLGVAYQLNPSVQFGLTYSAFSFDDEFNTENDSQIRFRTHVSF